MFYKTLFSKVRDGFIKRRTRFYFKTTDNKNLPLSISNVITYIIKNLKHILDKVLVLIKKLKTSVKHTHPQPYPYIFKFISKNRSKKESDIFPQSSPIILPSYEMRF